MFILDPNKETSDYATLRKTAIEITLGNGSPDKIHWLSLKQTVVEILSSNTNLKYNY
jgi:hypothetical protein